MAIAEVYLEREDPAENAYRFYNAQVIENLFGDIQLDIYWGRIGTIGRRRSMVYDTLEEAIATLDRLRFREQARGYTTLFHESAGSPFISLIPRRAYPYLDLRLGQLFSTETRLFNVSERMRERGVIYTGDFVKLAPKDIMEAIAQKSQTKERVVDHTSFVISAVKSRLSEFGLRLQASVPGWVPPHLNDQIPNLGVPLP